MNYNNIPQEMRQYKNWVCFKFVERKGKRSKMPFNPITGAAAKSNDPNTWVNFIDAVNNVSKYNGIGFQFTNSPFVGVDIDHCIENDVISTKAMDIVQTLNSYTEYSPSGTGLHIICKGNSPIEDNRKGGVRKTEVEIYPKGQYFTMTGNVLDGYNTIMDRRNELKTVHDKYIKQEDKPAPQQPQEKDLSALIVDDCLQRALKSAHRNDRGLTFSDLYNGNWQGAYTSQSDADMGLCNMLAYWAGKDASRMDEFFRRSALMRDKWLRDDYSTNTINKAIADCKNTYDPNYYQNKKAKNHEHNKAVMNDVLKNCDWPVTEENSNGDIVPIKAAFENTEYLCKLLGIEFKYNLLTKEVDISRDDFKYLTFDAAIAKMRGICHKNFLKITKADLIDNIGLIAEQNQYSPVCDYLNKCMNSWDEISRIQQLFNCFVLDDEVNQDNEFLQLLLRKWLISCVKLAFNDGTYAAQGILILCGKQGIGKTRFLYTLLPVPAWGADGMSLDPGVKDDILAVIRFWIVELGELNETLKKEKQDRLKAFFTRKSDNLRKPYKRASEQITRRTAFIGTVNGDGFLKDRTGERRYWVISVKDVKNDESLDIDQLWGEVMHLAYTYKERDWLNQEEIEKLNQQNEIYKKITSEEQILLDMLDWDAPYTTWPWVTSTELCENVGLPRTRNRMVGRALRRLADVERTTEKKIICPTNHRDKRYRVPPVKCRAFEFLA